MASAINLNVFKKHPKLSIAIVLIGGIVFYMLFLRGSSAPVSQAPAQVGYTDSNVNAASSLAAMQMQAASQGQAAQIAGQLQALQIQGQNDLNLAQNSANLQRDLAAFSLKAAQLDNAATMYGITKQSEIQMYGIQTSADIQKLTISSQLEALKTQANRDLMQQQIMTNGQIALGQQAAAVSLAGINAQEHIAQYSMDTTTNLAQITANTQIASINANVQTAQINADRDKYVAGKQAGASKTSSWAGVAVGLLGLFCDRHIKSIDKCVSARACRKAIDEMPVEFWHYIEGSEPHNNGDTAQHLNTYAQDFYRTLGADDWNERKQIAIVDYMGALTGAIKALSKEVR